MKPAEKSITSNSLASWPLRRWVRSFRCSLAWIGLVVALATGEPVKLVTFPSDEPLKRSFAGVKQVIDGVSGTRWVWQRRTALKSKAEDCKSSIRKHEIDLSEFSPEHFLASMDGEWCWAWILVRNVRAWLSDHTTTTTTTRMERWKAYWIRVIGSSLRMWMLGWEFLEWFT